MWQLRAWMRSSSRLIFSRSSALAVPKFFQLLSGVRAFSARDLRFVKQLLAQRKRPILPAPHRPNPAAWPNDVLTCAWLGHATVLINFFGIKIITDPVLGSSIGIRF